MRKLEIELIPSSMWNCNLRKILKKKDWDILRKQCYKDNNYKCEICGDTGIYGNGKHPVECHEKWVFDDSKRIQKLDGLLCLCVACHRVKHSGLWMLKGKKQFIINHLKYVNNWSNLDAINHINESFKLFDKRSQYDWDLDISFIDNILN